MQYLDYIWKPLLSGAAVGAAVWLVFNVTMLIMDKHMGPTPPDRKRLATALFNGLAIGIGTMMTYCVLIIMLFKGHVALTFLFGPLIGGSLAIAAMYRWSQRRTDIFAVVSVYSLMIMPGTFMVSSLFGLISVIGR